MRTSSTTLPPTRSSLPPRFLLWRSLPWFLLHLFRSVNAGELPGHSYQLIGVSGGLQEGFPHHANLHYSDPENQVYNKAIFVGHGLVRGYKAYLDLMEEGWREYQTNSNAVINPNVFATGCHEHANVFWLYLVDARQVMSVLSHEPRFLSITPDTGKVELDAKETSPLVKQFLKNYIQHRHTNRHHGIDPYHPDDDGRINRINQIAIPLVTSVYFNLNSHIPSPPYLIHPDGTHITNFPDSLALWAQVKDSDRTAILEISKQFEQDRDSCDIDELVQANEANDRYWIGIRKAIQTAEKHRALGTSLSTLQERPPFDCKQRVKFGVGPEKDTYRTDTRVNTPMTARHIHEIMEMSGYEVDFEQGEITSLDYHPDHNEELFK
jgi:hypothetical protein